MSILDDIRALNLDPTDPVKVAQAIESLALAPAARMKLINEWTAVTSRPFPHDLEVRLTGGNPAEE